MGLEERGEGGLEEGGRGGRGLEKGRSSQKRKKLGVACMILLMHMSSFPNKEMVILLFT